ncbi:hypothetical protein MGG_17412 [Pyricularia oryzae 70-15]|uniref:Uncharacterized protein n=3 Tax=Pyricularia oryzae TaxID=318829 RepID=G4NB76_PYRO7|nr:uncharacterized protein MGG_17412 [Pyricularia oryzae 70-15]EHA48838.1 hypothetical protein MGG_17412 [Pyricularia oryzae 70-15]ELQ38738.1 hypothetical protein OOU_Y34scaffold00528g30 [Pyricularia oryzae Y34]
MQHQRRRRQQLENKIGRRLAGRACSVSEKLLLATRLSDTKCSDNKKAAKSLRSFCFYHNARHSQTKTVPHDRQQVLPPPSATVASSSYLTYLGLDPFLSIFARCSQH